MQEERDENLVLYMMCPHCKKGWYGKPISYELVPFTNQDGSTADDIGCAFGNEYLKSYIVEGLAPTDVTKELTCLNCGGKYTPIHPFLGPSENTLLMWDFVAKAVTTVKGS